MLAQQVIAEVAAQDWPETELYDRLRRGWPFRRLLREDFDAIVRMAAEGFTTRRGRRGALIHRDAVNGVLRSRRGARTTALTSGGTIPDTADYQVLLEPENQTIGTVNEDFAVEAWRRFFSWQRVLSHSAGRARDSPGGGQGPTPTFPSAREHPVERRAVAASRARAEIERDSPDLGRERPALASEQVERAAAADQLVDYLAASPPPLAPRRRHDCLRAFFDEAGGCSSSFIRRSVAV